MLLYWDQVSSIVPSDYIADPEPLGQYMISLVQEELVHQIIPARYIYEIPHFDERFLIYLDGLGSELDLRRKRFARHHKNIHIEKLAEIGASLVSLGLAQLKHYPWYEVEQETAEDFMSYLAVTLGQLETIDSSPVTDGTANLKRLVRAGVPQDRIAEQLDLLRIEVLDKVLPVPDTLVQASVIREFKERRGGELGDFRRCVERELVMAAAIPDSALRQRHLDLFIDEAEVRIDEIQRSMQDNGWRIAKRGLSMIAAIPQPAQPFLGLTNAIWEAASVQNNPQGARDFAYAAHAGVELT